MPDSIMILGEPIAPAVTMISFVGIYSLSGSSFDLMLMIAFGVLGWSLRKLDVPTVPIILGILLGNHMEDNLRRAMVISGGDWKILFSSGLSIGLWIAAIGGFVAPMFLRRFVRVPAAHVLSSPRYQVHCSCCCPCHDVATRSSHIVHKLLHSTMLP